MSKIIASAAIEGAHAYLRQAEKALARAIEAKGRDYPAGFPETAYFLPIIYSFTGLKVRTLADLETALAEAGKLLPPPPASAVWLPYLGQTLDAGAAALFACETIEAVKYVLGPSPVDGIWLGAASDVIMRERGVEFVDGTAPGFAAITGAAPSKEIAVAIAKELQQKNLYVFMAGETDGVQFAEQLAEAGVQLGWETRLVPFGKDVSALVYALGFANRAALSFGNVAPGDFAANLRYNKNRIFAFVLAFGRVDPDKYALAAGAINYGFPVISDSDIPQILPTGICPYEHVVANVPHETMVEKALETRGCKVKITHVPIPAAYGSAFEGERIRKADVHVQFGGNITPAFEFVTTASMDEITDGEIELIGPDVDEVPEGSALPLAIWVEAAGRKMLPDFEPILERQMHHLINGAEGIMHIGQRDILWLRISKDGFAKGLRLKHIGEILHARFLSEYPAIVDKVKTTLITDEAEVRRRLSYARGVYKERNKRLESMTDESVEIFYSCLLCQSFAPDHVCVITPERLGLCGAYNWLDARAAFEIDETGPNQPVEKGACLDPVLGVWQGVNDYVYAKSHKTVPSITAYSIMRDPMTSCGCFEVILAFVPELNGVMAVNREFPGETPAGLTFSSLAGNVGGGRQTPGFMGCGKAYLTSRKFLSGDGGFRRLVWAPKELKTALSMELADRFAAIGEPDLLSKIADESVGSDPAVIREFLIKAGHPALAMPDMGEMAATAPEPVTPSAPETAAAPLPEADRPAPETPAEKASLLTEDVLARIKREVADELKRDLRETLVREIVSDIVGTLGRKYLGADAPPLPGGPEEPKAPADAANADRAPEVSEAASAATAPEPAAEPAPTAAERLAAVKSVPRPKTKADLAITAVTLGATKKDGGTRSHTLTIGGATAMPFHFFEGDMPHRPIVAMEVFDAPSEKYPPVLRAFFGDLAADPAAMARVCVDKYGADAISVRLDATHPERGGRSPEQAVNTVRAVLEAVSVPLIITGHNHFESVNAVMKAVAKEFAGENLLLNWAEQNNYRAIAGAALAYGHSLVAQSPIDVNIAKQLNILLANMDMPDSRILIDPMTGALGYGIEYSYSVMERIRLTALGGDEKLAQPMIVSPGAECAKIKEFKAPEADFPAWGDLAKRAALWEYATGATLVNAGADLLIMYHPEAAKKLKQTITKLMDRRMN